MAKRIGPEAKIISLFTALPDDSKRIVLEIIRSQTQVSRSPKSTTVPSAGKRSPRNKSADESKVSTEGATGSALSAAVCAVPKCGMLESAQRHQDTNHPSYHVFHSAIKTRGVGA